MKAATLFGKKLFAEEQRFRQTWLWTLGLITCLIPMIIVVVIMFSFKIAKPHAMAIAFLEVSGISIINLLLFYLVRFETIITDEAVFYRWWPFFIKYSVVKRADIKEVTIKKYPYFNMGYHKRKGFGKVNVVNGDKGVQLVLMNGQLIYLGTQRLPALEQALNVLVRKKPASVY
jgi:hypothetical protein